ncbi:nucleotide exchange factor GrpE [Roseospira visakhapatnamensis]|uniref:Protein GrpE n=1 Tax=Roseospira visakhapatnamensis TaxID=390880 RepID=A0A7W6RB78_9PROT|nr:nucleotide exchange factor GrpE [Roseospira visakhapatnamensis]MBB4265284.1 molecular chaperone GrpE [Roseospira visakhapatnamensis]
MTQTSAKDPNTPNAPGPETEPEAGAAATNPAAPDPAFAMSDDDTLRFDLDPGEPAGPAEARGADAAVASPTDAAGSAPDLGARVAALETELEAMRGDYLRALAEAQNTKRLADKRIQDNTRYAVANLAKALLSVADNMERALAAAPEEARAADPHLKNLAVGVEMTAKEFMGALGQYGVAKVEAMGQPFDPNLHQAVQEMENKDVPAGTVVQVYQAGYVIHDRLLRPAMVVVSRGGPKRAAPAVPADGGVDPAPETPKAVDTSA